MSDVAEYELRWRGRQTGPYSVAEINRMLDDHEIGLGHEILYEDNWITLEEFFAAAQKAPAPATAIAPATQRQRVQLARVSIEHAPQPVEKDSTVSIKVTAQTVVGEGRPRYRLLFALLALVAGYIGAHNFYSRQWLTGLLQLLLSIATFLMGFGIIASWLWAMVEALVVRRDGHGVEMI